jgi:hypothetical protein
MKPLLLAASFASLSSSAQSGAPVHVSMLEDVFTHVSPLCEMLNRSIEKTMEDHCVIRYKKTNVKTHSFDIESDTSSYHNCWTSLWKKSKTNKMAIHQDHAEATYQSANFTVDGEIGNVTIKATKLGFGSEFHTTS